MSNETLFTLGLVALLIVLLSVNVYLVVLLKRRKMRWKAFHGQHADTLDANVRLNEELQRAEQQFRMLVNSVHDYAIFLLDKDGIIITWNEGAERITGFRKMEALGKPLSMLYPAGEPSKPCDELRTAAIRGHIEGDGVRLKSDGRSFMAKTTLYAIKDGWGELTGFAAVYADITARAGFEAQLEMAKEEAEAANRAKSAFLANMSHEIRTPLGVILGLSELICSGETTEKEWEDYTTAIRRNGDHLLKIINDILDISKVEAGRLEIEHAATDLHAVLADTESLTRWQATEKGLHMTFRVDEKVPSRIMSDGLRLKQILVNLISNAIKFTEAGRVDVSLQCAKDELCFEVSDTGPGLSPEQRQRLFRPFMQADPSTSRRYGGTGLGLALSKRLARALKGDLDISASIEGKGTTFRLRLPLVALNETTQVAALREEKGPLVSLDGLKVLVVDDSPDNLMLVGRILRKEGALIETADCGQKALQVTADRDFNVVLMDLQMPDMDGYDVTKALRHRGFKQPIFALTAHAFKEEKIRVLASGFDGHLTKPVDKMQLIKVLTPLAKKMSVAG